MLANFRLGYKLIEAFVIMLRTTRNCLVGLGVEPTADASTDHCKQPQAWEVSLSIHLACLLVNNPFPHRGHLKTTRKMTQKFLVCLWSASHVLCYQHNFWRYSTSIAHHKITRTHYTLHALQKLKLFFVFVKHKI